MEKTMTARLEAVAKFRHEPPQEVLAEAVEIGVSRLYVDSILSQYLKKLLSRVQAVRAVGLDAVRLAESQRKMALKDVAWGLGG